MKVNVRGYEGILVELSSEIMTVTDLCGQSSSVAEYCVSILLDDGAKVEIERVRPCEIEVLT